VTSPNFILSSDRRLKSNITIVHNALDKLATLSGYEYTMKNSPTREYGVMADEVEKVLPNAVLTDDAGFLSVAYDRLIPLLVNAINELRAEVRELKNGN
jgi:hypothetical protein